MAIIKKIWSPLNPILFRYNSPSQCFSNYRFLFSLTGIWPITCTFDHYCMMNHFKTVEDRWKSVLNEKWIDYCKKVDPTSPNHRYNLSMFPYPSGSLHLGHVRIYATSDTMSRFNRLRGYSVVNPMGWDSFGLPAENAALEHSMSPAIWTYDNIKKMEEQLKSLGLNVNWREATSDPSFYRWTQWLFLQLFKSGLIFKSMSTVNWDPVDRTVLADDQVDQDGRSWRSGAKVEKRFLRQWNIKLSAFHDELYQSSSLTDTKNTSWKELLANQRYHLGAPETFIFYFKIGEDTLPVLCDYPEHLFSDSSYIAIPSDHWIIGLGLPKIVNPLNGNELEIKIIQKDDSIKLPISGKALIVNPDNFINEEQRAKVLENATKLGLGGYRSSKKSHDWVVSRQRYWGTPIPIIDCSSCGTVPVSEDDLPVALPPVNDLKSLHEYSSDAIIGRLRTVAPDDWLNVTCPKCGGPATRETDTLDTFVDSSWYYLRYATNPSNCEAFNKEANSRPIHLYVGGAEHCRGHLLFARYMYYFLKSKGFIESSSPEPFNDLLFLGYVLGRTIKLNGRFITEKEYESLIESGQKQENDFSITYEKMSKSKGNGIDPMELINAYGIDATRICLLGFGLPRRERKWKGLKIEYEEIFVILRRLFLTIDQFIYIREILNEKPIGPVVKRFVYKQGTERNKVEETLTKLLEQRSNIIQTVTEAFEEEVYPTRGVKLLKRFLLNVRKNVLDVEICKTPEYERCLGDILIMLGPVIPHLTEECWSAFCHYANRDAHPYYDLDKLAIEQKWPTPDPK